MINEHNIMLTPKQAEIFNDKSRHRVAICGRGVGKSFLAGAEMVKYGLQVPNSRILYIATTYKQAKDIMLPELDRLIHPSILHKKTISSPVTFELTNGSIISLHGANNPETFRGPRCDFVVLDEAASHPAYIFHEILLPAIAKTKGRIFLIGTPKGVGNWVNDLDLTAFSRHSFSTIEGGLMDTEEIENLRNILDENVFKQEILGEIVSATGIVYYQYKERNHSNQVFKPLNDTIISFDFNVNPMTCVLFQRSDENFDGWTAVREYNIPNSNTDQLSRIIKNDLSKAGFSGTLQSTGDFSGNQRRSSATVTDWHIIDSHFQMYTGYISRHRRTVSIRDRVNTTNQALKSGLLKVNTSECPVLHKELNRMEWKANGLELNDRGGIMGHISDAFSYMPYNYMSLGIIKPYNSRK